MSLHCVTAGAQWVVTDPGNTAQGIINAANTASTVKQTVEQVNRLQTALDYVQKVSATVRRARMFTDLIDRQNRDHVTYAYHQTEFGTCNGIGIWHQ